MKKIIISVIAVLAIIGMSSTVFARASRSSSSGMAAGDFEIDGSFAFATGPGDFDTGYGLNFGAGYTLHAVSPNFQIRADVSYFDFSYTYDYYWGSFYGYDLSYTRIPFTVSARYSFPVVEDRLRLFVQAGVETSYDNFDTVVFGVKKSESEFNFGVSPGGGIEFFINPNFSIFALGRFHIISDSYFSAQFGGAFHF